MSYKRKRISGRIIFTAAVLLTLVIFSTVCTLIGQRDSAEDTFAAHTTTSVEETDLLEAMISRPAAEQLDAFLPDYTSAVILNTTLDQGSVSGGRFRRKPAPHELDVPQR